MSHKTDCKSKTVIWGQRRTIYIDKDQFINNTYIHTSQSPTIHEAKIDKKGEIDSYTLIVEDFYTLLSLMNKTSRRLIRKKKNVNTINQPDINRHI